MFGIHNEIHRQKASSTSLFALTRGIVVDTDDPQQKGRLRICCPRLGDDPKSLTTQDGYPIPWATYVSPFAGMSDDIVRGPNSIPSDGPVEYGLWAVPTVGAVAIVALIDGYVGSRVWIGCEHGDKLSHTLPHGRYFRSEDGVTGPYTSTEQPINPLSESIKRAFGDQYEYITRGADYTVSALPEGFMDRVISERVDDKDAAIRLPNGTIIDYNQGYGHPRRANNKKDSQTVSLTTPGFHSLSMDDRAENCRIRIRTTSGHQILLDDTNERILINTAGGKSFIEMDSNGNIDIHAERQLSFHSNKDMSFTTDGKMRFRSQKGMHFISANDDIRFNTSEDVHFISKNMRTSLSESMYVSTNKEINFKSNENINVQSGSSINIKSTENTNIQASSTLNAKGGILNLQSNEVTNVVSGGLILQTAPIIHLNGPTAAPADSADSASDADSKFAYSTIRVPFRKNGNGQPWSHGMLNLSVTDKDTSNNMIDYYVYDNFEFSYEDSRVGKYEHGELIIRGGNWRR